MSGRQPDPPAAPGTSAAGTGLPEGVAAGQPQGLSPGEGIPDRDETHPLQSDQKGPPPR
jgi:hypothetical protein